MFASLLTATPEADTAYGARHGGKRLAAPQAALLSRWVRIFSITTGSSMQAMILTRPPQVLQVSMSMLNTRFRRSA